jgi:hypothetical protein
MNSEFRADSLAVEAGGVLLTLRESRSHDLVVRGFVNLRKYSPPVLNGR